MTDAVDRSCAKCGVDVDAAARFCWSCGAELLPGGGVGGSDAGRRARGPLLLVTSVVVAAVVLSGVLVLGSRRSGDPEESSIERVSVSAGAGVAVDGPAASRLVIPDGALAQETTITIRAGGEADAGSLDLVGSVPLGEAVWFDTGGADLSRPATVELGFDPDRLLVSNPEQVVSVAVNHGDGLGWMPLVSEVDWDRHRVAAEVGHFSWFQAITWDLAAIAERIFDLIWAGADLAGVPVAEAPVCARPAPADIMIEPVARPDRQVLSPCLEDVAGAGHARLRLVNRRSFGVLVRLPPGLTLESPIRADAAFDEAIRQLGDSLELDVLYLPGAASALIDVDLADGETASITYRSADVVIALELAYEVAKALTGGVGEAAAASECIVTAVMRGGTDADIDDLWDTVRTCLGYSIPYLGALLAVVRFPTVALQRLYDQLTGAAMGSLRISSSTADEINPDPPQSGPIAGDVALCDVPESRDQWHFGDLAVETDLDGDGDADTADLSFVEQTPDGLVYDFTMEIRLDGRTVAGRLNGSVNTAFPQAPLAMIAAQDLTGDGLVEVAFCYASAANTSFGLRAVVFSASESGVWQPVAVFDDGVAQGSTAGGFVWDSEIAWRDGHLVAEKRETIDGAQCSLVTYSVEWTGSRFGPKQTSEGPCDGAVASPTGSPVPAILSEEPSEIIAIGGISFRSSGEEILGLLSDFPYEVVEDETYPGAVFYRWSFDGKAFFTLGSSGLFAECVANGGARIRLFGGVVMCETTLTELEARWAEFGLTPVSRHSSDGIVFFHCLDNVPILVKPGATSDEGLVDRILIGFPDSNERC